MRWLWAVNWWAFTGCLRWPRGETWRAKHWLTRTTCHVLFSYVTHPLYDWVRARATTKERK